MPEKIQPEDFSHEASRIAQIGALSVALIGTLRAAYLTIQMGVNASEYMPARDNLVELAQISTVTATGTYVLGALHLLCDKRSKRLQNDN
jgi:hypothetical protein